MDDGIRRAAAKSGSIRDYAVKRKDEQISESFSDDEASSGSIMRPADYEMQKTDAFSRPAVFKAAETTDSSQLLESPGLKGNIGKQKPRLKKNSKTEHTSLKKRKGLVRRGGMITRHVANAAGTAASGTAGAAQKIKEAARQEKISELMQSDSASDMVKTAGSKGVVRTVKALEIVGNFVFRIIRKMAVGLVSLMGVYFFTAAAVLLTLITAFTGISDSLSSGSSYTNETSSETEETAAAGSVTAPRTGGSTALTYNEVHSSRWYSSRFGVTQFSGDIGLDKIKGDRGGNCTAYAWGRRCEIEGTRTQLGDAGDAFKWYDREVAAGIYQCGQTARVGAVCCWDYGTGKAGHVAVIEQINADGSIITSNSGYSTRILFYTDTFASEEELKSSYGTFKGYIYVQKVADSTSDDTKTESEDSQTESATAEDSTDGQ